MAELVVERRNSRDRGRRDLRQLAHTPQGLDWQIAVVSLDRLQDLQHLLRAGADLRDDLVNERQIQLLHTALFRARSSPAEAWPMQ